MWATMSGWLRTVNTKNSVRLKPIGKLAREQEGHSTVFLPAGSIEQQEQHLIQRVRDGEHELFYQLIQPYERRVWAATFAILRNEEDAEDVAQEAVLKALKHIRQFRAEARFSTWFIQIAVNEARMRRR